jgi:hypothetical protein
MRETEGKFATFVLLMAMMLTASGHLWAQAEEDETSIVQPDATTVRLTARSTAIINGIRAELRGDYRAAGAPIRLNAQLENVNLRVGTPVAFCVLHNGVQHLAGRGRVVLLAGIRTAKIELEATDGDRVPVVMAGDRLQARQKKIAPFNLPPTCGSPLLVSAQFH